MIDTKVTRYMSQVNLGLYVLIGGRNELDRSACWKVQSSVGNRETLPLSDRDQCAVRIILHFKSND